MTALLIQATSVDWNRKEVLEELRDRIWRYISPSSTTEQVQFYAAAALQLPLRDVRTLGAVQFLTSEEVGRLVEGLPWLIRRLTTSTERVEEVSTERVRGAIRWGKTYAARAASGLPHAYVTAPAERIYSTPENQMLVFVLDAISRLSQQVGWFRSTAEGWGREVSRRVAEAEKWRGVRMLAKVEAVAPTPREASDVRSGRNRRTYAAVIGAYDLYRRLAAPADAEEVRRAVESHAMASRKNWILLELLVWFRILEALRSAHLGFRMKGIGLVRGGLRVNGEHEDGRKISQWYQQAPGELAIESRYLGVLTKHGVRLGPKRPDVVLRIEAPDASVRWVLGEVKLYRAVEKGARAALTDLLAYRRDFTSALDGQVSPYGLGVVWGKDLSPDASTGLPEVALCSPDHLLATLHRLLASESSTGLAL